jgi:hypothetical protein
MSEKFSYTKCPAHILKAKIEGDLGSYKETVTVVLNEAVRLDRMIIDNPSDAGVFSLKNMVAALSWLLDDISTKSSDEHKLSDWNEVHSVSGWRHLIQDMWSAPVGEEPRIGQKGNFEITLLGKYQIRVDYRPDYFKGTDHLCFQHYRDGKAVSEAMPISETGYKSFFTNRGDFLACGGVKKTALAYCDANMFDDLSACDQLSLF